MAGPKKNTNKICRDNHIPTLGFLNCHVPIDGDPLVLSLFESSVHACGRNINNIPCRLVDRGWGMFVKRS